MELMTTLHGSALSFLRQVGGCVPLEGTIALARDPFKRLHTLVFLEPPLTSRLSLDLIDKDSHPIRECACEPSVPVLS